MISISDQEICTLDFLGNICKGTLWDHGKQNKGYTYYTKCDFHFAGKHYLLSMLYFQIRKIQFKMRHFGILESVRQKSLEIAAYKIDQL